MIQRKYYKIIRVIVDSDGGGTPFYIENIDSEPGYFTLGKSGSPTYTPNLNYRIDNGEWFEYDVVNLPRIEVPVGSKIYLKGNNTNGFNQTDSTSIYYKIQFYSSSTSTSNCKCNIGGYITSLLALENFHLIENIPDYAFIHLFSNNTNGLKSAENLITSNITSCGKKCFTYCFSYCQSLIVAPTFDNVTIVRDGAFSNCFISCQSLIVAPTFDNVTEIENDAFENCFYGCTSLVTGPMFDKVTTLGGYSFSNCFNGCTSLVTGPMFDKVTTLGGYSFSNCFNGCIALETIYAPSPSTWFTSDFNNWVINVPSTGTFYKKKGLSIPTGTNGIPEGWTVIEED